MVSVKICNVNPGVWKFKLKPKQCLECDAKGPEKLEVTRCIRTLTPCVYLWDAESCDKTAVFDTPASVCVWIDWPDLDKWLLVSPPIVAVHINNSSATHVGNHTLLKYCDLFGGDYTVISTHSEKIWRVFSTLSLVTHWAHTVGWGFVWDTEAINAFSFYTVGFILLLSCILKCNGDFELKPQGVKKKIAGETLYEFISEFIV